MLFKRMDRKGKNVIECPLHHQHVWQMLWCLYTVIFYFSLWIFHYQQQQEEGVHTPLCSTVILRCLYCCCCCTLRKQPHSQSTNQMSTAESPLLPVVIVSVSPLLLHENKPHLLSPNIAMTLMFYQISSIFD